MDYLNKGVKLIKLKLLRDKAVMLLIIVQLVKVQYINHNVMKLKIIKDGQYLIMELYQESKKWKTKYCGDQLYVEFTLQNNLKIIKEEYLVKFLFLQK